MTTGILSGAAGRVSDALLRELGGTHGGRAELALLAAGQHRLRLLQLRALSDAVAQHRGPAAPVFRRHWALLEAADRFDRDATRRVLFYPLVGPWVRRCLLRLGTGGHGPALTHELAYLGALAAAAAVRAGVPFALRLDDEDGALPLPTLGALSATGGGGQQAFGTVELLFDGDVLTVTPQGDAPAVIRRGPDGSWRSDDPRWFPLRVLTGGPRPVLLDEIDPFRTQGSGLERHCPRAGDRLTPAESDQWQHAWAGAMAVLHLGGETRPAEVADLLECFVPLLPSPGAGSHTSGVSRSGTRREAFGAVLSSIPQSPGYLAATLVHELQHAKLGALADLVPLHTADAQRRYWAPWRPDPRPFDGLLQGAYSHLALAEYWQLFARDTKDAAERDKAWAEHSRCREQVGAALPALAGSRSLTPEGRVFVNAMVRQLTRLKDHPPPEGHLARASAYVETARGMWWRRTSGGESPVYVPS
ncbi:HEXXH motif domain-containing protein [Streptomyces sp. SID13666]|uniref:HEXXH motif domain-containing protein n=1 Tax=unclassified Streptomyces TaxID=2593676 RepID=UPI0013C043E7|nr:MULTISPECIES: HEXXH motif domain-containing protein [unclassified Streptomyces]NEA59279.1 HEXXH motif domain-containing protein [Streptomyces sp. SID13666]NEA77007.1 HEXXH motif domain-containing protein [Streptomyces sp. SID13588]